MKRHHSGPRTYRRLVQSYREGGRVKHRPIAHLGRLDPMAPEEVEALINGLLRATGRAEVRAEAQAIEADSAQERGPCWLLWALGHELGLGRDAAARAAFVTTPFRCRSAPAGDGLQPPV